MSTSLSIQVPGKLMIAGEFAVLEPHHQLSVMAVDRYVYADLTLCEENLLTLHNFDLEHLRWELTTEGMVIQTDDPRVNFVQKAMETALSFLQEKQADIKPFHLRINSELDDKSGKKYGLGSSAAVVTAVVAAILNQFSKEDATDEIIFKLAAVSHVAIQGNGSGADVAASSYGGLLKYTSFQADWLLEAYNEANAIHELLTKDWTYFSVSSIPIPDDVYFCVGWTGSPASTGSLVSQILTLKKKAPKKFEQFLSNSEAAVATFLQGMNEGDHEKLFEGIKQNRQALATVGKEANVAIETPMLGTLCDLAEQLGGAGKPSGAGGGDCGIAFMPSKEKAEALLEAWREAGIKPLDIHPDRRGAAILKK